MHCYIQRQISQSDKENTQINQSGLSCSKVGWCYPLDKSLSTGLVLSKPVELCLPVAACRLNKLMPIFHVICIEQINLNRATILQISKVLDYLK